MKVEATGIEWRILCIDISLTNYVVLYPNKYVGERDKMKRVETLIKQGVIREMKPQEKGFFNLVMFLKQRKRENPKPGVLWILGN